MFTPIGFFAPSAAGFDPTLGGTLSVAYHWDFTDSSTMTLSGTDLDNITDKVGSITMQPYTGTNKATFDGTKCIWSSPTNTNGAYYNTTNWIPTEMYRGADFTIVQMLTNTSWPVGTTIQNPWSLIGNASGNGHNNLRMAVHSPGYDPYPGGACPLGGNYYYWLGRWSSGWRRIRQEWDGTTAQQVKNMVTSVHSPSQVNGYRYQISLNDSTYCDANDSITTAEQAGGGFTIGGAVEGTSNSRAWTGDLYHTVVYDQVLTETEKDDLYTAWSTF